MPRSIVDKTTRPNFIRFSPERNDLLGAALCSRIGAVAEDTLRRRRRPKMLAVGERRAHQLTAARAVLQGMIFDADLVARLDRVGAPSGRRVLLNGLHLERPLPGNAAVVGNRDV